MSKKNHRQIAHDNTTPGVEIYKTKNLQRMRKFDSNLIQNCSPKMPRFFFKNGSKFDGKIFSAEEMPKTWQEKKKILRTARHGAGGKEEAVRYPYPQLSSIPGLPSFQFSGFHCPAGRLLRTHPVISPVIS
jgi:hypothetical protein